MTRRIRVSILAVLLLILTPALCAAADDARSEAASLELALETAPVEIDGQVLFKVRGLSSFPAGKRAEAITERIKNAAADASFASADLRTDTVGNGTVIMAGKNPLIIVSDADAQLEQTTRDNLAALHLLRIKQAIDEFRAARRADTLLKAGLYCAGATVLLALVIAVLLLLNRWLDKAVSKLLKSRVKAVDIQSFEILRSDTIWKALHGLVLAIGVVTVVASVYVYLQYVLALFPWTRSLSNGLLNVATDTAENLGKSAAAVIPDILILVLIFYLARFALRRVRHFFDAVEHKRVTFAQFEPEWGMPTYKLVRVLILAFAFIVAYPYIPGSETAAFKGISIFIGLVISLGSSTAISNFIAGYLMTYRRVFKVGDRVKVGDVIGEVVSVRLQVTHIRTNKNEEITIPNSQILNSDVTNYSSLASTQGLILHTTVGIGYETPWRQVEAMLCAAAERTAVVLTDPKPFILLTKLGDFAVTYELNVYVRDTQRIAKTYADLHRHILDVFNEYGVQIMTPAYEGDPDVPKVVAPEQWYSAPAAPDKSTER
ncbi:mechanosensitive ion channel family protein [Achromobacter kerstersii]|jgi:small-conductance mechanosensitive channel|uniref:mechanosensitive ion channel family protein n=1 Tax=Achromobacter kerstersii TaxID=1353890 RepID=UPI0006C4543A|nr:mechanosensitive ion channel family protein [Achromobacter kerstersii]CUJ39362.1 Potassium efflux system KefA precursor [Achromobacter kerstersii]